MVFVKITGTNGNDVFNFNPETLGVKIPAKTGENDNEANNWYYGDGINFITPPTGKTFTPLKSQGEFMVNELGKKVYFSQGNLWSGPVADGAFSSN